MTDDWAELLERVHDQARREMGFCVQASDGNWCTRHDSLKFPGEEACRVMSTAYVIAESAAEVAEPLIRADERAKAHVHNTGTSSPDACCECCYDVPALLRWKREATVLLDAWERVYEALGSPGSLGKSKAAAALARVQSVEWSDRPIIGGSDD